MSASAMVQLSAAIGIEAVGPSGGGALVVVDLAEGHLVEPALLAVGREDEPVGAVLLEQLDLVALVEVADLRAAQLVGRVQQAHDAVADDPPLATRDRSDEALAEGQARGRSRIADRVGLAGLEQRRTSPAREEQLEVDVVLDARHDRGCDGHRVVGCDGHPVAGRDGQHAAVGLVLAATTTEQAERHRGRDRTGRGHQRRGEREPGEGRRLEPDEGEEARHRPASLGSLATAAGPGSVGLPVPGSPPPGAGRVGRRDAEERRPWSAARSGTGTAR